MDHQSDNVTWIFAQTYNVTWIFFKRKKKEQEEE